MADYTYTDSRNVLILRNIVYGENNVIGEEQSRIESILHAILDDTGYTDETYSRMEKILKAIANRDGTPVANMAPISRNEDILLTKINHNTYTSAPQSQIEEILIDWDISSWVTQEQLLWAFGEDEGALVWEDENGNLGRLIYSTEGE